MKKRPEDDLSDILTKMMAGITYQQSLPSVKTVYIPGEGGAEILRPVLRHSLLNELFTCGGNLPPELCAQILALPADTLAADLCAVIRYAIADYERMQSDAPVEEGWLMTHAYFLGGAVQDAAIIDCLLAALSEPEEIIEFYFGDLITEGAWWSIYRHLPGGLDQCAAFLGRPAIYGASKLAVLQGMLYLHGARPEMQESIMALLLDLANKYLQDKDNAEFADNIPASEIAHALIEHGSEIHLQAAKALLDAGLVNLSIGGDYEEMLANRGKYGQYTDLPFTTLDEVYDRFVRATIPDAPVLDRTDTDDNDPLADWQPGEYTAPLPPAMMKPFIAPEKTGRNEPCPCGSGKKYKKCCLGT